jgi:hypothetical protein
LGLGIISNNKYTPTQINTEVNITTIVSGGAHSFIVGENGKVYGFGPNGDGRLGVEGGGNMFEPYYIRVLGENNTTSIGLGGFHSFVIDKENNIYSFGDNGNGQLAIGSTDSQSLPNLVSFRTGPTQLSLTTLFASKWNMISIPRGYVVSNDANITRLLADNSRVWTYTVGNGWTSPATLTPFMGLWIRPLTSSIDINGTVNSSYNYTDKPDQLLDYKGERRGGINKSDGNWYLMPVQFALSASDMISTNLTPSNCQYTQYFYFDSNSSKWNAKDTIPENSAIWIKHCGCVSNPS